MSAVTSATKSGQTQPSPSIVRLAYDLYWYSVEKHKPARYKLFKSTQPLIAHISETYQYPEEHAYFKDNAKKTAPQEQFTESELNSILGKDVGPSLQPGPAIGSDSWIGADSYDTDDQHNAEVLRFFNHVKWDVLAAIASRRRDGVGCSYAAKFSIGQFNLVRRLNFDDGTSWVARVRLPPEATPVPLVSYDGWRAFEVEVASMRFFKLRSKIPVPEVYAYDINPGNDIGAPYMLIEYMHGTTASELRRLHDSEPSTYGTIDQDRKFLEQMAKIQAEVLSFHFTEIGSLYYSEETFSFSIGPELETGLGPWISSTEYYHDLANELLKRTAARCHEKTTESPSFALPVLLNHLMSIYNEERTGPFRLINRDFGAHNILVDNDFNIVEVVDFVLSCMDVEPPGYIESNPYALERIKRTEPQLARYQEWLTKYEAELGDGSAPVGSRLMTTSALVYQGFLRNSRLLRSENETWFASALKMLRDHAAA